jgi:CspA family cold shock protein
MPETGVVKWFNNDKGYGFIKRSTGEDVFVHHSSIQASGYRTLNEGERVEFDVKQVERTAGRERAARGRWAAKPYGIAGGPPWSSKAVERASRRMRRGAPRATAGEAAMP